jgi:hypothetical protein
MKSVKTKQSRGNYRRITDKSLTNHQQGTEKSSIPYEEIAKLILVLAFSLLAIGLFIGYLITRDIMLFAADTAPATALAVILPHYFKKR